jgi:hypothetical protein
VSIYDATGVQTKEYTTKMVKDPYSQAMSDLLKDGWESFSVNWEHSQVWCRLKVEA